MKKVLGIFLLVLILCLYNCKIADISKESDLQVSESVRIAEEKLEETVKYHGFEVMQQKKVYSFTAIDRWSGFVGKMAKIWPDAETRFKFKHNFNTFDGSTQFLSGKREGDLIGVQSWQYYEKESDTASFTNKDTGEKHNSLEFGTVIFHYFLELPYRLQNAPIKRYYGQEKVKGDTYDRVFASWSSEAPNDNFDQYILYINTDTKLVDYCIYTLRANTNPMTKHKYGSVAFLDYKDIEGFLVPTKMTFFLDDGVIQKKSLDKYFHQLTIHDFSFGGFDELELYPLKGFKKQIDTK